MKSCNAGEINTVMLFIVIFVACMTEVHAIATQCPNLVPGANMILSSVEGYIGDPAVVAHCDKGHVFTSGQLTKVIECINSTTGNDWAALWNDTIGVCRKKSCPLLTTQLGSNMTASHFNTFSEYGDTANVTCNHGYAFSVDMGEPVVSRVTSSVNITCEDDPASVSAVWSDIGTCSEIVCDSPYDVTDATSVYSSTTFGSTVMYECYSGHRFVPDIYNIFASCNLSAEWDTENGPGWILGVNVRCTEIDAFVGCIDDGGLIVVENATGALGTSDCRSFCKSGNYRYASLKGDLCACGDRLAENFTTRANTECDSVCADYDLNSTSVPAFCGGGTTSSVFSSLAGCYKNLNISGVQGEIITDDYEITCSERCRAKDEAIAAVQSIQCFCFNTTNIEGTEVKSSLCTPDINSTTSEYTMVYDLAKTAVTAETCEKLYTMGVRMHGYYYLAAPHRREFCHFKDGTACEDGWIGYDGHCYLFGAGKAMNFTDARDFCISNNADLASITTEGEFEFMKETRKLFENVWVDGNGKWWTGLYDSNGTKLYSWIDGSVMRFAAFGTGQPSADKDMQCAMEIKDKWDSAKCSQLANVVCKKSQGWDECKSLASPPTSQFNYTNDLMTLTFCLEKCKGKNTSHAVLQNRACWCVDSVPSHTNLNKSECDKPCPGDPIQFCGGVSDIYMVLKVAGRVIAKSCDDLQILGIGNDTYLTSPNTIPILEYCNVPECPYSWVSIGRHCYKFYPIASRKQALTTCAESDSYIVSIETVEEMDKLISTANNISIYSSQDAWRIGLQVLSLGGPEMRWSNGFEYESDIWNDTMTSLDGPEVILTNMSAWIAQDFSDQSFICESGGDYIGCYNTTGIIGDIVYEYNKMTIQQCVELCRAKSRPFAYISAATCNCETALTNKETGLCTSTCPGQHNQICGGDGIASVYNVSEFVKFADTCDDLFNAGIFISEEYIVNGTLHTCVFKDGTNCSYGWVGYQGHCYQHFAQNSSETRVETCTRNNASLTSLTRVNELRVLEDYLNRIQFNLGDTYMVYTGITNGLYGFNVTLSQDGLLTDPELVSNGDVNISDLYDHGHITLHGDGRTSGKDGGVLCKHNKYNIRCFNRPNTSVTPDIANFTCMELTLCKQTCIGKMAEIALVGLTDCYCRNISDLSSLSAGDSDACNRFCKLVPDQVCGDGSVVWAHFTAANEVPLADNCSALYKGGVFLTQTYKLANPERYEECGFTDTSVCPVSWLGNNNTCLKVMTDPLSYSKTRHSCSNEGGYLFNPIGQHKGAFLQSLLIESGLFHFLSNWQSGIYPVFYNKSYVTSRGEIVEEANFEPGGPPDIGGVYYNSNDAMLYERTTNIPYICETDEDYTDCASIHKTADAQYDVIGNSITMCVYWCKGQGHDYSAMSHTTCKCFRADISADTSAFTLHPGTCTTVCSGIPSQTCGNSNHHRYYTYVRTLNVSVVPKTCSELYLHGVFKAGQYLLDYNGNAVTVHCFSSGALSRVSLHSVHTVKVSSSMSGHTASAATLAYPYNTGWKPSSNEAGTWIKITFSDWYLVAGLFIKGIHTDKEQSFIKTYGVEYRNLITGSMNPFPYNSTHNTWPGCTSSYAVCPTYPFDPVVTTQIKLYPLTWHSAISLQVSIYGQPFSNFNHADPYQGCVLDGDGSFSIQGTNGSLETCLDVCRNLSKQFAGKDEFNNCLCGEPSEDYGFVDEGFCPYNDTLSSRLGTDSLNIRAMYRTYVINAEGVASLAIKQTYSSELDSVNLFIEFEPRTK